MYARLFFLRGRIHLGWLNSFVRQRGAFYTVMRVFYGAARCLANLINIAGGRAIFLACA